MDGTAGAAPGANAGGNTAGNPAGAGAPNTGTAAPGTGAAAPAPFWSGFKDQKIQDWAKGKNFPTPEEMASNGMNLEQMLGGPRERLLVVPEGDDPAAWNPIYDRLGRPKAPGDYKFSTTPDQGGDPEFQQAFGSWAHEAGISQRQLATLEPKWNGFMKAAAERAETARIAAFQSEQAALKQEWGDQHDANFQSARTALTALGLKAEQLDKISNTAGFSTVMKLFAQMHNDYGVGKEHGMAGGRGSSGTGANSPAQAQEEINKLMKDTEFGEKLRKGDPASVEKWDRLHRQAAPAGKAA